jgi:glycosyltransferase involved in cell wall biosynthesis
MNTIDFTVAIRTYNGAKRLPVVLDSLRSQIDTEAIQWEVVVVDNNSDDHTAEMIREYQNHWQSGCELRYFFEPQQGAAIARRRAIQEARGKLIGFLDDDNVPASDWVSAAYRFGEANPQAGAYSSEIHGVFEVEPPPNFQLIAFYLPIIERKKTHQFDTYKKGLPPGAGLVIRKQAWIETVPDTLVLQGPVRQSLTAKGEDIEALRHIHNAGWQVWHNPDMHIDHHIPTWRLERDYLIQFFRGIGLSRYRLRMVARSRWKRPIFTVLYLANDLYQAGIFFIRHHHHLKTDTVTACQMELLIYTCLSPFFTWKRTTLKHP